MSSVKASEAGFYTGIDDDFTEVEVQEMKQSPFGSADVANKSNPDESIIAPKYNFEQMIEQALNNDKTTLRIPAQA